MGHGSRDGRARGDTLTSPYGPDTTNGHTPTPSNRHRDLYAREQKLALMGDRRSGKSSIQGVVFHKQLPQDTLFTEASTTAPVPGSQSFLKFNVVELPEHIDFDSPDTRDIFRDKNAVIWVIDAQDQYLDSLAHLLDAIAFLTEHYPRIRIAVFVHKVDGLSEEYKEDTFRDIRHRVTDEMQDRGYRSLELTYHQTSIYDHTVFEAVSKVVQKLLPRLESTLERLLNSLCSTCRIQKALLFDMPSKIFIASDTSPQDSDNYFVCADLIDVVVDVGELWGWDRTARPDYEHEDMDLGHDGCESMITMEQQGHRYLYLKEMNRHLALVCIMADDNPLDRKVLIDYNVGVFADALAKVWNVEC